MSQAHPAAKRDVAPISQAIALQGSTQAKRLIRIYNYYRLVLGLALLLVFLANSANQTLGSLDPDLFVATMSVYVAVNLLIVVVSHVSTRPMLTGVPFMLAVVTADVLALTLAMYASGGVTTGLAALAIASIAAGAIIVGGRTALVLPAIATLAVFYEEFLRALLHLDNIANYFQGGIIGTLYFLTGLFVRGLAYRLRTTEIQSLERALEVADLERLSDLVIQRMQTGIIVTQAHGTVRMANGAARLLLGSSSDIVGAPLTATIQHRLDVWRADREQRPHALQINDAGPELRVNFSAIGAAANSDVIVFLEDQSELNQHAQQLKLAALGRLSASIAHEIRNPLGAISHAAQLLGESELDSGDRRLAEIIQNHCRRMNEVIANVLELSRRRLPAPERIRLGEWLQQFITEYRETNGQALGIDVTVDPLETEVHVDAGQLRQVLTNLTDNALRYSRRENGTGRIRLIGGVDRLSDRPFLNVIDDGPGVPADKVHSLFEPFFTTEVSGTGLGLYISRELCEANQARLSYVPAEPHGSCFRIGFAHPKRAMA